MTKRYRHKRFKKHKTLDFYIFDGRTCGNNEAALDDAMVLECCESLQEAKHNAPSYGQCAIWSTLRNSESGDYTWVCDCG
jgi:hypothetical protein